MASNRTSPQQFFATFVVGPSMSAAAPSFTLTGSNFLFDPSMGNLLLEIMSDQLAPNADETYFDRYSAAYNSVFASTQYGTIRDESGLVTRFDAAPVTTTPEPASLVLLGSGLVGVFGVVRRRRTAERAA